MLCYTDLSQLQVYLDKMLWLVPGFSGGYEDAWKALSTYGGLLLVSGLACTPVIEKLYHKWQDKLPVKVFCRGSSGIALETFIRMEIILLCILAFRKRSLCNESCRK